MSIRAARATCFLSLAAALPYTSAPVHAQLAGGGAAAEIDVVRLVLALVFCLILGIAVIYVLRRRLPIGRLGSTQGAVRVVDTVRLGVRGALHVVEYDGRRILLAADANGAVTVVATSAQDMAETVPRVRAE